MLARLVAALDARPDADIVHADFLLIDDAGNQIGRTRVGPVDRLLHGNNIGACFLYRARSEEHTSELQSLMRLSYAVFCLNKTKTITAHSTTNINNVTTANII